MGGSLDTSKQTPQTTQSTGQQTQSTGPSVKGSNSFKQGDTTTQANPKANPGSAVKLSRDLGEVVGLDGFSGAVGAFIDANTPGEGASLEASLKVAVKIPVTGNLYIKLGGALSLEAANEGANKKLKTSLALSIVGGIDLLFGELEAGYTYRRTLEAAGDSGYELMRLTMFGLMPTVQATSTKLAGYMYGNVDAYTKSVLSQMDGKDKGEDEQDSVADVRDHGGTAKASSSMPGSLKAEVGGELSHRDRTTMTNEGGKLASEKKSGLFLSKETSIGGFSWKVEVDSTTGEALIETVTKLPAQNKALAQFGVQLAQAVGGLGPWVASLFGKDQQAQKEKLQGALLNLAKTKVITSHAAAAASVWPDLFDAEIKAGITLKGGGGKLSVVCLSAFKKELGGGKSPVSGEVSVKSGQQLFAVPF